MAEPEKKKEDLTVEELQLQKIEEMKSKMDQMVDPEEFKKLQDQYKKLMDDYLNKRPEPKPEKKEITPVKEVAQKLASIKNGDISNREYIKTALEYRESFIHETGKDPFTDFGESGPQEPNTETNKVANTLQTLLDENETNTSFRIALNEVLKDDPKLMATLRKRANKVS